MVHRHLLVQMPTRHESSDDLRIGCYGSAVAHDPESSEAAAERVSSSLRLDVTEGRLGPGDRLKDLDLAVRFGVSRLTIRESLRLLAAEGLVTVTVAVADTEPNLFVAVNV